jgi:type 1 glutamine amidotransferase
MKERHAINTWLRLFLAVIPNLVLFAAMNFLPADGKPHGPAVFSILGNFHILVLHLPIAFLLIVPLLELLDNTESAQIGTRRICMAAAVSAWVAALLGIIYGHFNAFEAADIQTHLYAGIGTSCWASISWYCLHKTRWVRLFVQFMAIITMFYAAHSGGEMVHGPGFPIKAVKIPNSKAEETTKPIKVLLVIGGCCHDYATQKDLIKAGIESRINATVEIAYNDTKDTKPLFEAYKKPNWADAYDVIIHDECAADITDTAYVEDILKAHRDGKPAVNLHCGMHSYRWGNWKEPITEGADNAHWYEMIGLQSNGHGPKLALDISFFNQESPITKGLTDWTTFPNEELYNNIKIFQITPLVRGSQMVKDKKTGVENKVENIIAWTNLYGPNKTRIFSTTLGHDSKTVADERYLDFITRGLLWSVNHLTPEGKPEAGYGKK